MSELPVRHCGTVGSTTARFKNDVAGSYWTNCSMKCHGWCLVADIENFSSDTLK